MKFQEIHELSVEDREADEHRIKDRLRSLKNECAARLEAASVNREALCTQMENIQRILHEETTQG